jgi:hypothetical protein
MDILQRIDNATVGHKGNAALLGRESWRELNGSLKAIERIYDPRAGDKNLVVNIRGRDIFCIPDESLWPHSVKTHNVDIAEGEA